MKKRGANVSISAYIIADYNDIVTIAFTLEGEEIEDCILDIVALQADDMVDYLESVFYG